MSKLTIYPQADFPAILKWQAISFIKTEWPFVFSGDDLYLTEPCLPELDPVHFALSEGESLVSYASIFRLPVDHAGATYQVYGFGNLFTFPPYRHQGYGRQVLASATAFITDSDIDVAILFCEPELEPLYTMYGWQMAQAPTRIGTPKRYEPLEGVIKMNLYVSPKGQQGKADFETQPLYVAWPW